MTAGTGWEAHLHEGPDEWARHERRLTIYRRNGDGSGEQLIGWDEFGMPEVEQVPAGAVMRAGFRIPAEALPSLRDAIEPGPSAGEVRRLEEALEIERRRVDQALAGAPPQPVTEVLTAEPPAVLAQLPTGAFPIVALVESGYDWETADGQVGHTPTAVTFTRRTAGLTPDEARKLGVALFRQAQLADQAGAETPGTDPA